MGKTIRIFIVFCAQLFFGCGGLTGRISSSSTSAGEVVCASEVQLIPSNIKSGVNICGVLGTYSAVIGTDSFASLAPSSAIRDPGIQVTPYGGTQPTSSQISLLNETTTYASSNFPASGGLSYRNIPDMAKDDDGYMGFNCKYASRPNANCGTTQTTIADRIADCLEKAGVCSGAQVTKSTCEAAANTWTSYANWDGAAVCNGSQGSWKLVTRSSANVEVWQDQKTKLIWSSKLPSVNWCQASGNVQSSALVLYSVFNTTAGTPIQGNGTVTSIVQGSLAQNEVVNIVFSSPTAFTVNSTSGSGCNGGSIVGSLTTTPGSSASYSKATKCSFTVTQGAVNFAAGDQFVLQSVHSTLYSCQAGAASGWQPATPESVCSEEAGLVSSSTLTENWGAGSYSQAKGGMGANSIPKVIWRLPTLHDYYQATLNGIIFVMPDMGRAGSNRPVPDGSLQGMIEFTATINSNQKKHAWTFSGFDSQSTPSDLSSPNPVRCVGR